MNLPGVTLPVGIVVAGKTSLVAGEPLSSLPVTGWQGNDGGQGDWNQNQNQPFGPEPGTNQYGTDPYLNQPNQYGADPYAGGGYDQQHAQHNPYTQPYPQYQTGGFPAQGYGPPPPPPPRSKLPMILSLVAIVIIIGAVVAIVLVNRKDSQQTADPQPNSSSSAPKTSPSERQPSERNPSSTGGGGGDDWIPIDNTADSGLTYEVPADWEASSTPRASGLGVDFTGNADYGNYDCEGSGYVRTFAASGDVQGKSGEDLDLKATMTDFANSFAKLYYGEDATIDVPAPTETEIDGKPALTLTAKITPKVTKPACQATEGEVAMVGILLETDGKPKGVAMLAVVNDLAGGPETPKPIAASVSQDILKTVKVG